MTYEVLLLLIPSCLALGAFVGFCAGLLGIGGGLILVPGLYYLLGHVDGVEQTDDILMHTALATSMAIILPTAMSSSWAQIKRKAIDWNLIKLMSPGLIIGVSAGVFFVSGMNSDVLKYIFSVGLVLIALSIILKNETSSAYPILMKRSCAFIFSSVFGVFATMLGIGGAVLNVPYLNRAGIPLKTAIASGSVLGVIVAFIATLGYLVMGKGTFGYINPLAFLMIIPASVLMAPLGVKASHAIPVAKLKIIFAVLLICVAAKMFFETL